MNSITFLEDNLFISVYEEDGYLIRIDINQIGKEELSDNQNLKEAEAQIKEYLRGERKSFNLKLKYSGTSFQKKVFEELMKVEYGKTVSYKELSEMCDNCNAYRAVGNAVGKNPLPIVIPCHRVLKNDGSIGGFSLGLDIKRKLLKIENIKVVNEP